MGSPPHMRGKVFSPSCTATGSRITPAHAGKSCRICYEKNVRKDHPRTCGEKVKRTGSKQSVRGSPPHMRGKEGKAEIARTLIGITPAHAGKRMAFVALVCNIRDHPRTCGEKSVCCPDVWTIWGSPPHMRGKVLISITSSVLTGGSPPHMRGKAILVVQSSLCCRITPAHAGKRKSCVAAKTSEWDHPRTCGEKRF